MALHLSVCTYTLDAERNNMCYMFDSVCVSLCLYAYGLCALVCRALCLLRKHRMELKNLLTIGNFTLSHKNIGNHTHTHTRANTHTQQETENRRFLTFSPKRQKHFCSPGLMDMRKSIFPHHIYTNHGMHWTVGVFDAFEPSYLHAIIRFGFSLIDFLALFLMLVQPVK